MSEAARTRLDQALAAAAGGLPVYFLVQYLFVALLRLPHPFALEWIESGMLQVVQRVLEGRPIYGPPSLEYTPFIYMPLYAWVCAAVVPILGAGLAGLRLVSLLSSIGLLWVVFLWARRAGGGAKAGLLAAGLLAASYRAAGAWLDVARVDSLFVFLLLLGLYLATGQGMLRGAAAGVVLGLALLTKQQALLAALPAVAWLACERRVRALPLVIPLVLVTGGALWWLNRTSGGWFLYYTFVLPGRHENLWSQAGVFWQKDLWGTLPLACLAGLYWLIAAGPPAGGRERAAAACLLGCVAASWLSRMHWGGYENVLLPAYAMIAVLFGPGAVRLRERLRGAFGAGGSAAVGAMIILQYLSLLYNPVAQVPTGADYEAGRALVRRIAGVPGEVLVLKHPYLARMAGKPEHAHWMALLDALRAADAPVVEGLRDELSRAVQARRFAAIVLDDRGDLEGLEGIYVLRGAVFETDVFWPVTGMRTRPELWYEPAPQPPDHAPRGAE